MLLSIDPALQSCKVGGFNGHPPLGVNATEAVEMARRVKAEEFQWAPTLRGECYLNNKWCVHSYCGSVSMGTHP